MGLIWLWILKNWKGMIAGALPTLAICAVFYGFLYSAYTIRGGNLLKEKSKTEVLTVERDREKESRRNAEAAYRRQKESTALWRKRHNEANQRLIEANLAAMAKDAAMREELSTRSAIASDAINAASSTEDAVMAFVNSIVEVSNE